MYQVRINQVLPSELMKEDIRWLVIGAYAVKFFAMTAEDLVERAKRKEITLYRVTGSAEGIFAVSFSDDDFFIETMAGKNFLKCADEIHNELKILAGLLNKRRIAGWVARSGLMELYEEFGKPVATLYIEDL